jgi:hypothetical protein
MSTWKSMIYWIYSMDRRSKLLSTFLKKIISISILIIYLIPVENFHCYSIVKYMQCIFMMHLFLYDVWKPYRTWDVGWVLLFETPLITVRQWAIAWLFCKFPNTLQRAARVLWESRAGFSLSCRTDNLMSTGLHLNSRNIESTGSQHCVIFLLRK